MEDNETLKTLLSEKAVTIKFTKADESIRTLNGTTCLDLIPIMHHPKLVEGEQPTHIDLIKVFDLDINAWRAFKPSKLISFHITME